MDLVVIAGTIGPDAPWTNGCPRPLLPLPGEQSLLDALLDRFETLPGAVSTVCANGHTELIAAHTAGRISKRQLILFEDGVPRGAAGCLKACAVHLTSQRFFLSCGSVWLDDDPRWMLEQHRASGNVLTVFCRRGEGTGLTRAPVIPAGIYCCEREALNCIRPTGYQDLKEQWVPALQEAGLRVGAVMLQGDTREVQGWPDYLRTVAQVLFEETFPRKGYDQLAPGVWCGEGTRIAPTARIIGPGLIGRHCSIGDDAVITGPTILGEGSRVGHGAWVSRLSAPGRIDVPAGACVADRLIPTPRMVLSPHGAVRRTPRGGLAVRIKSGDMVVPPRREFARNGVSSSTRSKHN